VCDYLILRTSGGIGIRAATGDRRHRETRGIKRLGASEEGRHRETRGIERRAATRDARDHRSDEIENLTAGALCQTFRPFCLFIM
jgi:hypothetical protein